MDAETKRRLGIIECWMSMLCGCVNTDDSLALQEEIDARSASTPKLSAFHLWEASALCRSKPRGERSEDRRDGWQGFAETLLKRLIEVEPTARTATEAFTLVRNEICRLEELPDA